MTGLMSPSYLGDGAYAGFDGHHVVLYTHDGVRETNRVCLDPATLQAFEAWLARHRANRAVTYVDLPGVEEPR